MFLSIASRLTVKRPNLKERFQQKNEVLSIYQLSGSFEENVSKWLITTCRVSNVLKSDAAFE